MDGQEEEPQGWKPSTALLVFAILQGLILVAEWLLFCWLLMRWDGR